MNPRWLISLVCVVLLMSPSPVAPQAMVVLNILKMAACTISSATFVLLTCTNYGAPTTRQCVRPPFGCFPWNIKPLGLCEPLKICCNKRRGFDEEDSQQQQKPLFFLQGLAGAAKSTLNKAAHVIKSKRSAPYSSSYNVGNETPLSVNGTESIIPSTPEEYMKDWPKSEDDPVVVEKAIEKEFDKFMLELNAINKQEVEHGREAVRVPSFEEFRSVAMGETHIQ